MDWQAKETNEKQLMKQNVSSINQCDDSEIKICAFLVGITDS